MGFSQKDAERLLAITGRLCCLCRKQHRVSLHHINAIEEGGTDDIDNAIPLCPNCHDEVHTKHSSGRVTKTYSSNELKQHRENTIMYVKGQHKGKSYDTDKNLKRQEIEKAFGFGFLLETFRISSHSILSEHSEERIDYLRRFSQKQLLKIQIGTNYFFGKDIPDEIKIDKKEDLPNILNDISENIRTHFSYKTEEVYAAFNLGSLLACLQFYLPESPHEKEARERIINDLSIMNVEISDLEIILDRIFNNQDCQKGKIEAVNLYRIVEQMLSIYK